VIKSITSYNSGGVKREKFMFNSSRVGNIRQNHRIHRISYGVIHVQSLRDFSNWERLRTTRISLYLIDYKLITTN